MGKLEVNAYFPWVIDMDGKTFCTMRHDGENDLKFGKMFVACPELFDSLNELIALNDEFSPFGGEIYQDKIEKAWNKARAAISKAKGE